MFFTGEVSAHFTGQPPFFKINNQFSNLYPVPSTSLQDFNLPQDLASENYLVGQSLDFELDLTLLPIPPKIVDNTKFKWDFGDGSKAEGVKSSHIYKKPGSYFLTIEALYKMDLPQLIQSVMINVLPDKNYKLPQSVIKINGKKSKDPLTDILKFGFEREIVFEGLESKDGSGKIVSYFWDFGDQNSATEGSTHHKYAKDLTQVFPVLRIKDENGFIADSFLEIENAEEVGVSLPVVANTGKNLVPTNNKYYIGGGIVLLGLIIWGLFFRSRKK